MRGLVLIVAAAVAVSGCATKRYGRLQPVSSLEATALTCEQLAIEQARVAEFERQVRDGARINALSVLAFANDLGLGNAIEKDAALDTARERRAQLSAAQASRGCSTTAPAAGS